MPANTYTVTLLMPQREFYVHDNDTYLRRHKSHALCRVRHNGDRSYMIRVAGVKNEQEAAAYGLNEIRHLWGVDVPGMESERVA